MSEGEERSPKIDTRNALTLIRLAVGPEEGEVKPESFSDLQGVAEAAEVTQTVPGQEQQPAPASSTSPDLAEPPGPKEVRTQFNRLLDKVQLLALQKVEQLIARIETEGDPVRLVDIIAKLADLRLSAEWSAKLGEAIKKNPALMSPGKGGSLTEKLRGYASRTKKAAAGDGRMSAVKLQRAVGDGAGPVLLPSDD